MPFELAHLGYCAAFAVFHFGVSFLAKFAFGERRGGVAVQGGTLPSGKEASRVRDLFAYNLATIVYQAFCAYIGTRAWFDGDAAAIGGSAKERLYGYSAQSEKLVIATWTFELYNTIAVMIIPEYSSAAFIGHHFTTGVLGVLALHPFVHHYCPFFLGVGAISSVPLACIELTTILGLPAATEALRTLFAVIFLVVRTCYWPIVSAGFWSDVIALHGEGALHDRFAAGFFLLANVGLTGLQLFWTTMIIDGIKELARGKKKDE